MVDKTSPMPMYYQIEEDLKSRMKKKEFISGEVIPSERELSDYYKVSRMTVRQAVNNMVNDGLLYREKGKGTFVAEEKIAQPLQGMTSFTEDMKQRGMEASSELTEFEVITPSANISEKLQLNEKEQVFKVQRIRFADKKPMAIESTFIPVRLFPDLTKEIVQGSFYQYVEERQQESIHKATQVIEAMIADQKQAQLLQISPGAAVLHIERNSYLSNGSPFEVVKSVYRSDRYKFISDISRT